MTMSLYKRTNIGRSQHMEKVVQKELRQVTKIEEGNLG